MRSVAGATNRGEDSGAAAYVPAAAFKVLTPLYDPIVQVASRERAFKEALLERAGIEPGMRVLDVGCGTGTLAIWAKRECPDAVIDGLDGDPEILERARRKAAGAGVEIELTEGFSTELPWPDASFDRVLSSLLFHHLVRADKARTLTEINRVLRPGGELHVADLGKPADPAMAVLSRGLALLDGREQTADNIAGNLPALVAAADFTGVSEGRSFRTAFGVLRTIEAIKPG